MAIVRVFLKKTEKTPRRETNKLAQPRKDRFYYSRVRWAFMGGGTASPLLQVLEQLFVFGTGLLASFAGEENFFC